MIAAKSVLSHIGKEVKGMLGWQVQTHELLWDTRSLLHEVDTQREATQETHGNIADAD